MSLTIGLRYYRVSVTEARSPKRISFSKADPFAHFAKFVAENTTFRDVVDRQRSWRLDLVNNLPPRELKGLIRYGTFGFESEIVDRESKKRKYTRSPDDLEQIPLFFHFWLPEDDDFGLAAFQSFQGRSCVQLLTSALEESYRSVSDGLQLRFEKVSPNYLSGTTTYKAPVKKLTLLTKRPVSDPAAVLLQGIGIDEYNYEVSFVARRNGSFGSLAELMGGLKSNPNAVLIHGDQRFEKAVAEISWNGRRRRVGIAGADIDTGAIDVTEDVKLFNGHPTFESIAHQSDILMDEIYEKMTSKS